jgi:Pyruvate/2-oxoacid:ferredoxin oxidoreductase gamma subunit
VEQVVVILQKVEAEVEQVDFVLAHHFQFVEQHHIQLQLEQEEQEQIVPQDLVMMEHHQYFQQ